MQRVLTRCQITEKLPFFLIALEPAQELYFNTLKTGDGDETLDEVIAIFEEYFKPKTNEIVNTFNFNKRVQEDGEHFDAFYTELRNCSKLQF